VLDAFTVTKGAEPSFLSLLLFADRSGQSPVKRVRAQPTQKCVMWDSWWHLVHYHTLRISAVPVITFVLMCCCTQGSAQGSREVLPSNKTSISSARGTSMFLHFPLTAQKLWRGHVVRLVLFGVLNSLSGLSSVDKCVGKCTWKNHTYTYMCLYGLRFTVSQA
jgi:hypothetical protein